MNPTPEHTLLFRLVGPMQSWGFRSRFDNRDTALEPTRSGVIGVLCAALGIGRNGDLSRFDKLRMGVRVDAPGRVMVDYHTWMLYAPRERRYHSSMQSWRYYLADARFLVGLESTDRDFLLQLEDALKNPHWALFLGRKSFPPSLPLHLPQGGLRVMDLQSALVAEPWMLFHEREDSTSKEARDQAQGEFYGDHLAMVLEDEAGETIQADAPLDFARRQFGLRSLRREFIAPESVKVRTAKQCYRDVLKARKKQHTQISPNSEVTP